MPSQYYDEQWELVPEHGGWPAHHKIEFVRSLPPVERALDFGCGDGRLTREIRAEAVTAVDVSVVALARARGRLPGARLAAIDPGMALPFEDASFDLVLCADALEHVQDLRRGLTELKRVLTPLGSLAITTPAHDRYVALDLLRRGFERRFDPLAPPVHHFTATTLRHLLGLAGLRPRTVATAEETILAVVDR